MKDCGSAASVGLAKPYSPISETIDTLSSARLLTDRVIDIVNSLLGVVPTAVSAASAAASEDGAIPALSRSARLTRDAIDDAHTALNRLAEIIP